MIFVSIALLVVAAVALGIGIASSSVPPLVVSIIAIVMAAGVLWASFVAYRKEAAKQGRQVTGLGGNQARNPGYPEVYSATAPSTGSVPPAGAVPVSRSLIPEDWDYLDHAQAVELVSTFNLDELHELRRYEIEHSGRDSVLAEIDQRIATIVQLRRRTTNA